MKTRTLALLLLATCSASVGAGCAALATDRGISREAYQRGVVQREPVTVDTTVVTEVDTLIRWSTEVVYDTTVVRDTVIDCDELTGPVPVRLVTRILDTLLVHDTVRVTLRDTVRVRFDVPVPRSSGTRYDAYIQAFVFAAALALCLWLVRRWLH